VSKPRGGRGGRGGAGGNRETQENGTESEEEGGQKRGRGGLEKEFSAKEKNKKKEFSGEATLHGVLLYLLYFQYLLCI
jgi:hypothetical protein